MLNTLINLWREDLKDQDIPFIVIQLANYAPLTDTLLGWQTVQAAQVEISKLVKTVHTVISCDVCEDNDIHPATKIHLSERITNKLLEV